MHETVTLLYTLCYAQTELLMLTPQREIWAAPMHSKLGNKLAVFSFVSNRGIIGSKDC